VHLAVLTDDFAVAVNHVAGVEDLAAFGFGKTADEGHPVVGRPFLQAPQDHGGGSGHFGQGRGDKAARPHLGENRQLTPPVPESRQHCFHFVQVPCHISRQHFHLNTSHPQLIHN